MKNVTDPGLSHTETHLQHTAQPKSSLTLNYTTGYKRIYQIQVFWMLQRLISSSKGLKYVQSFACSFQKNHFTRFFQIELIAKNSTSLRKQKGEISFLRRQTRSRLHGYLSHAPANSCCKHNVNLGKASLT